MYSTLLQGTFKCRDRVWTLFYTFSVYSEKTAKLEELQDKNISQKEVLRDMTANIEVQYVCDWTNMSVCWSNMMSKHFDPVLY